MKKIIFILFVFAGDCAHAQTWDEWFNQKKTKKKYLLQQIEALQVYACVLEKGYAIASQGLHTIQDIKHGEFGLYSTYFNSLKTVNPKIKHAAQVAATVVAAVNTIQYGKKALAQLKNSGQLNGNEISYVTGVFAALADEVAKNLDALITVVTDGKLQMTDDERIRCIDQLYAALLDQQAFAQSFANSGVTIMRQRQLEVHNINILKSFYNSK